LIFLSFYAYILHIYVWYLDVMLLADKRSVCKYHRRTHHHHLFICRNIYCTGKNKSGK